MSETHDPNLSTESSASKESLAKALSEAGFFPANVERKIVSEGKSKEPLKKRLSTDPNE